MALAKYFEDITDKLRALHREMAEFSSIKHDASLSHAANDKLRKQKKKRITNEFGEMKKKVKNAIDFVEKLQDVCTDPAFDPVDAVNVQMQKRLEAERKAKDYKKRLKAKATELNRLKSSHEDMSKRFAIAETRLLFAGSDVEADGSVALHREIQAKDQKIRRLQELLSQKGRNQANR